MPSEYTVTVYAGCKDSPFAQYELAFKTNNDVILLFQEAKTMYKSDNILYTLVLLYLQ